MQDTIRDWFNAEDIKYLYRNRKISLEEANYSVYKRVLAVLSYATLIVIGTVYLLP